MTNIFLRTLGVVAVGLLTLVGAVKAQDVVAENAIRNINTQLDGDRLFVRLDFERAPVAPVAFKTGEPVRLIFDFPKVANQTGKTNFPVNTAGLRNIQLIQTEAKTRMMLVMSESRGYETQTEGNSLVIKLAPFRQTIPSKAPRDTLSSQMAAPVTKLVEPAAVREVTFRRGEEGQALILVDLTDSTVPLDVRRTSNSVIVDLQNTAMPERLLSKRDVNDFATPASALTISSKGNQSRIEILAKGTWIHQAQLVNDQLRIEIRQLTAAETNRLVPIGQEGKKISVNFYDADLGMVLRTLAELSGRNVIVDPSLNGRKITITLEGMPYDQALDLVLNQTNAGIRIKPDVVIFGARDVLLKRDQDLADELSRANETAPLITETFQLDYISAQDMEGLIRVAQNETSSGALEPSISASPESGAGGKAKVDVAMKMRGIMSSRGILSYHGSTNKLFVRDTQAVVDQIRQMIKEVDVPPKQVMVEARIVEAGTEFTQEIGVRLRYFDKHIYGRPGSQNSAFGSANPGAWTNTDLFGTSATPSLTATSVVGAGYDLSKDLAANNLGIMLFNSTATKLLNIELQAAENDQKGKTISSPRVVTQNRKGAKIENELSITVPTGFNPTTGLTIYTTYKAPLTLEVTPSITPSNRVNLDLKILKSRILTGDVIGEVRVEKNTVNTNVIVDNGGTVVIGGFYREEASKSTDRIPFLGDLPYVGFLFKATQEMTRKSELLVFITPRIVNEVLAAP